MVWKGARRPTMLHMFLSYSVVSLCVDLQINPYRPSPSHSATESQSFRFSVNIFGRSAPAGGPKHFFSPGPEPALGGPGFHRHWQQLSCESDILFFLIWCWAMTLRISATYHPVEVTRWRCDRRSLWREGNSSAVFGRSRKRCSDPSIHITGRRKVLEGERTKIMRCTRILL